MTTLLERWFEMQQREIGKLPYPGFEEDLERSLWVPGRKVIVMPPAQRLFRPPTHEGIVTLTQADMTALEKGLGGFVSEDPVTGQRHRGRVNFGQIGQLSDLEIAMVLQTGRQAIADEPARRARRVIDVSLAAAAGGRQRVVESAGRR